MTPAPAPDIYTTVRNQLHWLCQRFDLADRALRRAAGTPDRQAAEAERQAALSDHGHCTHDLADLFLLLLRQVLHHEPGLLRGMLLDLLRDDLRRELAPDLGEFVRRALARREGANGRA
jgi:hypothetical protein